MGSRSPGSGASSPLPRPMVVAAPPAEPVRLGRPPRAAGDIIPLMLRKRGGTAVLMAGFLAGCSALVQRDPVTGRGTFTMMSEEEEIGLGAGFTAQLREQCLKEGVPWDEEGPVLRQIREIGRRLVSVCHRPHLPWEFHFLKEAEINAFAVPGGKVFVLEGLFGNLVTDEEELAAVLAHEVAHVTARHTAEGETWKRFTPLLSKSARSEFYRAAYGTRQEDEADRVGLLYMALAGYDPAAAPRIWHRAHRKYGSDPGNYLYDHSLNLDRARKVEALLPVARRYYRGPGQVHPEWKSLLARNDLVERSSTTDETGAFVEALVDGYVRHQETRQEAKDRERKKAALDRLKVSNLRFAPTSDGKAGIFVDLANGGAAGVRQVVLTIRYLDDSGRLLHQESIRAGPVPAGGTIRPGFYRRAVAGSTRVSVQVTDVVLP